MPPTPAARPDPNLFFATFLAGLAAGRVPAPTYAGLAKEAWHVHRDLVGWVASGTDVAEYEKRLKDEADRAEKARKVAEADEARKAAQTEALMAAHGAR